MGYFSEEDLERRYHFEEDEPKRPKRNVTKESLIKGICLLDTTKKAEELEKLSFQKLKLMKEKMDLLEKQRFFSHRSKEGKPRLYEYEDDDLEMDGFSR